MLRITLICILGVLTVPHVVFTDETNQFENILASFTSLDSEYEKMSNFLSEVLKVAEKRESSSPHIFDLTSRIRTFLTDLNSLTSMPGAMNAAFPETVRDFKETLHSYNLTKLKNPTVEEKYIATLFKDYGSEKVTHALDKKLAEQIESISTFIQDHISEFQNKDDKYSKLFLDWYQRLKNTSDFDSQMKLLIELFHSL